ncbi:MAG: HEAT repeat domain-containing protein [Chitinophagaceae bacterium]
MKEELEEYIQNNLDQLDRSKPAPAVLNRVLEQLQPKEIAKPGGILISFRAIKWAAACVLVIAGGLIIWQSQKQTSLPQDIVKKTKEKESTKEEKPIVKNDPVQQANTEELTADTTAAKNTHPGIDAADRDLETRKSVLATTVRNKRMFTYAGFGNITSAAERINTVAAAAALQNSQNEVVNGLVDVLNKDPNTNVRLAALDALARFYRDDYTRKKLVGSLKKQKDPVVQIALIGLLTRMRESGIVTELEKMVTDENTEKTVKDCAYSSMLQLNQ